MRQVTKNIDEIGFGGMAGCDTAAVLFFLALEYGRAVRILSIDGLLMGITMAMVLVLPYFLPSRYEKPEFDSWLIGRGAIALLGILLGFALRQVLGLMLPDSLRFMPMTLLILASMISCYIQFYRLMKLRLAK